jgi:hypothetical protein
MPGRAAEAERDCSEQLGAAATKMSELAQRSWCPRLYHKPGHCGGCGSESREILPDDRARGSRYARGRSSIDTK